MADADLAGTGVADLDHLAQRIASGPPVWMNTDRVRVHSFAPSPDASVKKSAVRRLASSAAGLVVVRAADPGEGVVDGRDRYEGDLWLFGRAPGVDLGLGLWRAELVLLGDVHQQRLGHALGLGTRPARCRRRSSRPRRPRRTASPSGRRAGRPGRSRRADLAAAAADRRGSLEVAVDVLDALVDVEGLVELEGALSTRPPTGR